MGVKSYCTISAVVFGIVGVVHLVRVVQGWAFTIGPIDLPVWVSGAGAVVALALCVAGLNLSKR
jgi:hypothetical protein